MGVSRLEAGLTNEFDQPVKGVSLWRDAWRRLRKNRMALTGLVIVGFYALISVAAPILPIHSYKYQVLDHQYLPPSLTKTGGELYLEKKQHELEVLAQKEGRSELNAGERAQLVQIREEVEANPEHQRRYLLGTDALGRDMLARIIYGGQVSIAIGLIGTIMSVLIGILVGSAAGYLGGKVDSLLMRVVDIMYGLPYMLIVIILMALFGKNILNLFLALAFVSWLTVARVIRGQIMSLRNAEFIEAARSMGAGTNRIILRHLIPNTLGVIIIFLALRIPSFIMMEAFLSYLGLGVSAPYASWGSLVREGVEGMSLFPWRLIFPALAMTVFLFSMNFLGDGMRDAFDPQSKNRL
ncbi:MAG: ABC transporter permease [Spirochaetales bacterium]|nr:ABC transporter permease [Spirochaetales bacterium]MCF7938185.1 ABC transporter permease [Spirochaetales bacterium]